MSSVIFDLRFKVEFSDPNLPKIVDDRRYAARSLQRQVETRASRAASLPPGATPPPGTRPL